MRRILGVIALMTAPAWAWNVSEMGFFDSPNLAHYLDVIYDGDDRIFVCGSGGFDILDVTDITSPQRLGHVPRPGIEPLWNLAVNDSFALVCAGEAGLHIVDIQNHSLPDLLTTFEVDERIFEDVLFISDRRALVCLGNDGLGLLSIEDPMNPEWIYIRETGLTHAKAMAIAEDGDNLFIADESEIVRYFRTTGDSYEYGSTLEIGGSLNDIAIESETAYLPTGSDGVMIIDISSSSMSVSGQFDTNGIAAKVSVAGNRLVVANWEDLEVFDVADPANVELIGFRHTPLRAMCATMVGDTIVCGDWEVVRCYAYGEIAGADLEATPRDLYFPITDIGQTSELPLTLRNFGQSAVTFSNIMTQPSGYTVEFDGNDLAPGDSALATVIYTPVEGQPGNGRLRIQSNDEDESPLTVNLRGNPPPGAVGIGQVAPDFTLPEHRAGDWTLSDQRGRVVVLLFFASW